MRGIQKSQHLQTYNIHVDQNSPLTMMVMIRIWDTFHTKTPIGKAYCDVPGSPCLSKTGLVYSPFFCFKFFQSTCERTKGSLTPCLVAAWSPWWFVGDPTSLARDNILCIQNNCPHAYTTLSCLNFMDRTLHMQPRAFWIIQIYHTSQWGRILFKNLTPIPHLAGISFVMNGFILDNNFTGFEMSSCQGWDNSAH